MNVINRPKLVSIERLMRLYKVTSHRSYREGMIEEALGTQSRRQGRGHVMMRRRRVLGSPEYPQAKTPIPACVREEGGGWDQGSHTDKEPNAEADSKWGGKIIINDGFYFGKKKVDQENVCLILEALPQPLQKKKNAIRGKRRWEQQIKRMKIAQATRLTPLRIPNVQEGGWVGGRVGEGGPNCPGN